MLGSEVSSAWIYNFKCLDFRYTSAFFLSSPFFLDYRFPLGVAGRGITPLSGLYNQIKRVFLFSLGLLNFQFVFKRTPCRNLSAELNEIRIQSDVKGVLPTFVESEITRGQTKGIG